MRLNTNSPAYVLVFAAVVSAVFTGAIMALHAVTSPIIERNERLYRQRALVDVFGFDEGKTLSDAEVADVYARRIRPVEREIVDPETGTIFNVPLGQGNERSARMYRAVTIDEAGKEKTIGYALPIWGVGFWARIDGYLAVSVDLHKSLGIVFVRHSETPGLGGRITERQWREQFAGLDVTDPATPGRVIYIGGESGGATREGRYVDAVTGATGTSRAVETFLRLRLAEFRRAMASQAGKGGD